MQFFDRPGFPPRLAAPLQTPRPEKTIAFPQRLSVWFFALSLMFAPLNGLQLLPYVSWSDAILVTAVLLAVIEYVQSDSSIPLELVYLFVLLCLLVPMFAGGLRGEQLYPMACLVSVVALSLIPLSTAILRLQSWQEVNFLIALWTLGGVIGVLYIVLSVNGLLGAVADPHWEVHGRTRGLTFHPSLAGRCVFLTLPGLFYGLFLFRSFLARALLVLLIIVSLKALDYTGTRAAFFAALAFVGFFVTLSALLIWDRRAGVRLSGLVGLLFWSGLAVALVAVASSTGVIEPIFDRIWDRFFGSNIPAIASSRIRNELNANALAAFWGSPLVGQGYQWSIFTSSSVAHNIYLQYMQIGGVVGLLGLLTFLLFPTWMLWNRTKHSEHAAGRLVGVLVLSIIGAIMLLIAGQAGFNDYSSLSVFCLALILARSSRLWELGSSEPAPSGQPNSGQFLRGQR